MNIIDAVLSSKLADVLKPYKGKFLSVKLANTLHEDLCKVLRGKMHLNEKLKEVRDKSWT